jgi:peroxiredoxin Q/BCP
LQDDKAKFDRAGALILGVNSAPVGAHQKYCQRMGFEFPLLADSTLEVSRAFGALSGTRIRRKVVVIGPDGRVRFSRNGMPTDDEILGALP